MEETPNITTREQAQSQVREKLFAKLSVEQQRVLKDAKLQLGRIKGVSEGEWFPRISGEVKIDGEVHRIRITSFGPDLNEASIDGERCGEGQANELFAFYFPIAQIQDETEFSPTEASTEAHKDILINKLLGK